MTDTPTPIYTALEARAVAMEIEGVVDAYVLTEGHGSVTLTVVVLPGSSLLSSLEDRLVSSFMGRTKAGIAWSFEVLEGQGPS